MGFLILRSSVADGGGDSEWQLDAGHFQPSIHTFDLWYPCPDADTEDYAHNRRAPSTYDRRIHLAVVGGNPPYWVEINSGPPGMTVENDPTSADYLVLTIPAVQVGTWTIDIDIFEQGGTSINRTWSFAGISLDDTAYFVHLADGSGGSEIGTSSNPFRQLGDIIGPDEDDATYANRQVIVTGTHLISGHSAEYNLNGQRLIMNLNKPQVWVAATVGGATFRGSAANDTGAEFHFEASLGASFSGFNWNNPRGDQGGSTFRNCFIHGLCDVFDNAFDGTSTAPTSGSNSAVLFTAGSDATHPQIIIGNTYDDCDHLTLSMAYDTQFAYIGRNVVSNSATSEGFFFKGGANIDDIALHFNRGITGNSCPFSTVQTIQDGPPWSRLRIEYLGNTWKSSTYGLRAIGASGDDFEVYSTRNSWKIANHTVGFVNGDYNFSYDSIEHSGSFTQGAENTGAGTVNNSNNDHGTTGILDDTTVLQDGGPDGTHGAEFV